MKILYIVNAIKDEKAGTAGAVLNVGSSLQTKGQEVDYLFRDDISFFKDDTFPKKIIASLVFPILVSFFILAKGLDKKYDIISISSGDGFLYAIIRNLFDLKRRAKLIMESHGLEHLYWKNFKEEMNFNHKKLPLKQILYLSLIRMREVELFIRNCDLVMSPNADEKKYIQENFKKTGKVVCIPNGVSESFFVSSKNSRNSLLFVGDWNLMKGREYLVQIFLSLLERFPDIVLSIVVHNDDEDSVLKSFPKYVKNKIRVFKNVCSREMAELYASHNIFLFPSISEGFGRVILEAMAAGVAVVITEDLGGSAVIKNWENGVLIRKRDTKGFSAAVIRLLENEDLRKDIGVRARQTAKNFVWEEIAKKTLLCYEMLIRTDLNTKGFV